MKKKDILVLTCLRENPRRTLTKLSKMTSIPISTVYDKIRLFEESIIKKHTALLDFSKLGFDTRAHIAVKVHKEEKEDLKNFLAKHLNVNSVFKINNGYDYLAECIFKNIRDVEEFLDSIEQRFRVKQKQIYYLIDDIKRESFLADKSYVDYVWKG